MTMARHNLVVQDEAGNIIDGASIEVRTEAPGGALAALYSDRDGISGPGNPFTATDGADAGFHVAGGSYKIRAYTGPSGSPTFERIWRYIGIGLLSEADAVTATDVAFNPSGTGLSTSSITTQIAIAELDSDFRDRDAANIFDWIPETLHADIQARTSSTDVSSYFRQAIADVGLTRRIYAPSGTYVFTSNVPNITAPSGVFGPGLYLFGDGPGKTIFDNRAGVTAHTDTFATTNLSVIVTVTRVAHGLSAESQITIHGASAPVGGLSFDGTWMVESVPTADTFTFNHTSAASSTTSGSVTYGATNPLFDIDTTAILKFQQFVHLHDFSIVNTTSPTGSVGIRLRRAYQVLMERIWIDGMTKNGVHITIPNSTAGDRDGANMVTMRHMRIENCPGWGIDCELRSASTGANEFSFFGLDQVFVQACGTSSVSHPPPSGGVRWKGQVIHGRNVAAVINENCGLFIQGAAGLANTAQFDTLVLENNKKKAAVITGLSMGNFRNLQMYQNDTYTSTAGLELDGDNFVVRNISVDGAVIRATSGNSSHKAFYRHGANADKATCVVDMRRVAWENYDHAGQTRNDGWSAVGKDSVITWLTSGSGTFNTTAGCTRMKVTVRGGGAGGAGSGSGPGNGGAGGNSTFGTLTANGGAGASGATGGAGGTASGGTINKTGGAGTNGSGVNLTKGGDGGTSPGAGGFGGGGAAGAGAGVAAPANSGGGGGGGGVNTTVNGGGGGGGGALSQIILSTPSTSYSYAVGGSGTAGTAGTGGAAGGVGSAGEIVIEEFFY